MRTSFEGMPTDAAVADVRSEIPLSMGSYAPGFQVVQSIDLKGNPRYVNSDGFGSYAGIIVANFQSPDVKSAMDGSTWGLPSQEDLASAGISERIITRRVTARPNKQTVTLERDSKGRGLFGGTKRETYVETVQPPDVEYTRDQLTTTGDSQPAFVVGYSLMSQAICLRSLYRDAANRPGLSFNVGVVLDEANARELTQKLMDNPRLARSFAQHALFESIGVPLNAVPIPNFDAFTEQAPHILFTDSKYHSIDQGVILSTR